MIVLALFALPHWFPRLTSLLIFNVLAPGLAGYWFITLLMSVLR